MLKRNPLLEAGFVVLTLHKLHLQLEFFIYRFMKALNRSVKGNWKKNEGGFLLGEKINKVRFVFS